jgi:hypothetical protein
VIIGIGVQGACEESDPKAIHVPSMDEGPSRLPQDRNPRVVSGVVARKQGGLAGWPAARCLYTHPTARSDDLAARAVDLGDTSAARALARLIERHGISRE